MGTQNLRISRIAYPRGTLAAMVLLVVFFLGFGVVAEAYMPDEVQTNSVTTHETCTATSNA